MMKAIRNSFGIGHLALSAAAFFLPLIALAANPLVSSFNPIDSATGVETTANLLINFDQTVIASGGTLAGSATITLFKNNGTTVEVFGASSGTVSVSGNVVTINPTLALVKNTSYYVQVADDAFENAAGEQFAGIANATTWRFTTRGGGGAASRNRKLRAELLQNMPTHYNKSAPCLADVGIYDPNSTCTSSSDETDTQPAAPVQEVKKAAPLPPIVRKISPELEEARRKRSAKLAQALKQPAPKAAAQEFVSNLHERVCGRVERRFADNQKMIVRINDRLTKRFGFVCDL